MMKRLWTQPSTCQMKLLLMTTGCSTTQEHSCHFVSLIIEFRDALFESDGDRMIMMRCWKIFLSQMGGKSAL